MQMERVSSTEASFDTEAESYKSDDLENVYVQNKSLCLWSGNEKKRNVVLFNTESVFTYQPECKSAGLKYHLTYKMIRTESKLIRTILGCHGFKEVPPSSPDFNLMWTGSHPKIYGFRGLQSFQKINHFPRSYEITRKDRLYKNVQKMQIYRSFDFLPLSFVMPTEFDEFSSSFLRDRGTWIVKPIASSRGRGIFLINNPEEVSTDENLLVCKYINNPLLINGFKFDLRFYVVVTCFDPLLIYLYEEGLARFATVKYNDASRYIKNKCMHLTNYSLNKKSSDYIRCNDPSVENFGNKWSMSALLRHLKSQGKDTIALMMKIEDIIIKTIISAESSISLACRMHVPHRWNCFELFGFDILIDENLKPWVLEVNLSPSLNCDSPLDTQIKSHMMSDMLNLIGISAHNPAIRKRRVSAEQLYCKSKVPKTKITGIRSALNQNNEELAIVRRVKSEYKRRGGFIRIFPSKDSWELYGYLFQSKSSYCQTLHTYLYPLKINFNSQCISSLYSLLGRQWNNSINIEQMSSMHNSLSVSLEQSLASILRRVKQYTKKKTYSKHSCKLPEVLKLSIEKNNSSLQVSTLNSSKMTITKELSSNVSLTEMKEKKDSEDFKIETVSESSESIVDILSLMDQGYQLSKFQARRAFSHYLKQIDQRLIKEVEVLMLKSSIYENQFKKINDQMNLVFWFLKKASTTLSEQFRVVVPVDEMILLEKHRLLSKQIKKFIQIYNNDSLYLCQKPGFEKSNDSEFSLPHLSEECFSSFIDSASETKLEEILMRYIWKKSDNEFLNSKEECYPHGHCQQKPVVVSNSPIMPLENKEKNKIANSQTNGYGFLSCSLKTNSLNKSLDQRNGLLSKSEEKSIFNKGTSRVVNVVKMQLETVVMDLAKKNCPIQWDTLQKCIKNSELNKASILQNDIFPESVENFHHLPVKRESLTISDFHCQEENVPDICPDKEQHQFHSGLSYQISQFHISLPRQETLPYSFNNGKIRQTLQDDMSTLNKDLFTSVMPEEGSKNLSTCQL